jgi:hypothetical protein
MRSNMTNEATLDRVLRIVVGLFLLAMVFIGPQTSWGWLGVVLLLTGLVGYCPLYGLFGISTSRRHDGPASQH